MSLYSTFFFKSQTHTLYLFTYFEVIICLQAFHKSLIYIIVGAIKDRL